MRLWGRRAAIRKEEQKLPISLFFIRRKWSDGRNSGRFLFWSFACALKILRILSAFQGIVLVGALLSLLTSSATKPGSGSWGVQFLSPPLRWHASLGDELGQSTRSVHRRWCQLRPQVDNQRSLFTGQRHRDNSNPRNWTNNMPRYGRSSNQHLLFSSL